MENKKTYLEYTKILGAGRFISEKIVQIKDYSKGLIPLFCDEMYISDKGLEVIVINEDIKENWASVKIIGADFDEYEVKRDALKSTE